MVAHRGNTGNGQRSRQGYVEEALSPSYGGKFRYRYSYYPVHSHEATRTQRLDLHQEAEAYPAGEIS